MWRTCSSLSHEPSGPHGTAMVVLAPLPMRNRRFNVPGMCAGMPAVTPARRVNSAVPWAEQTAVPSDNAVGRLLCSRAKLWGCPSTSSPRHPRQFSRIRVLLLRPSFAPSSRNVPPRNNMLPPAPPLRPRRKWSAVASSPLPPLHADRRFALGGDMQG